MNDEASMRRWISVAACFVATSAVAQVETVRVVKERAAVAGCERLGEVRGSSLLGGIFTGAAYDSALNEMREKVVAAGGNHLLLFDLTAGQSGANGFGEAYSCTAARSAPEPRKRR